MQEAQVQCLTLKSSKHSWEETQAPGKEKPASITPCDSKTNKRASPQNSPSNYLLPKWVITFPFWMINLQAREIDSTVYRVLALHIGDLDSISGTTYAPLSLPDVITECRARNNFWILLVWLKNNNNKNLINESLILFCLLILWIFELCNYRTI